ncbi:MAG: hypothetical protein H6Q86_80 [candidate division NC10 bacterium]|nr:hypothetical protein [candidate division NC10 bacterium]
MKEIGQPIRELDVEPLRYPTALPAAPAEPTPAPPPDQPVVRSPYYVTAWRAHCPL